MKTRLKQIRKYFHLTQNDLACKLGLKQNTIATYEMGKGEPNDTTIILLCKMYNISENWLRSGVGDMLLPSSDLDRISTQHNLSAIDVQILQNYLNMDPNQRKIFTDLLIQLTQNTNTDTSNNDFKVIAASSGEI